MSGRELKFPSDWRHPRWKLSYQIIPPCRGRLISCALLVLLCLTGAHLSSGRTACPSLVVGCFVDQVQSWRSVTDFTQLHWSSYLLCSVLSNANSKHELPVPTHTMHCFGSVGNVQLLLFGVSRQDVRGLEVHVHQNENYWRDRSQLPR